MEVSVQVQDLTTLPPGTELRYPLNRRLCELQRRSGRFGGEKNLFPLPRYEPRIVHAAAQSLYRLYYPGFCVRETLPGTLSMELAVVQLIKCISYRNKQFSIVFTAACQRTITDGDGCFFVFPPDFISQKSAFFIFTLVGTSNLTVKFLVIILHFHVYFSQFEISQSGILGTLGFCEGMPGVPRNAEHTVYMPPHPFFFFLFCLLTKSKTVFGFREVLQSGRRIHGQKCFKKTALAGEVSLPACLICRSDIV